jgi:hypothetical protein
VAEIVHRRRIERERLIDEARSYVDRLAARLDVLAAAVVGSVARGDFNVWSDVDVVVVCRTLPERPPDRAAALADPAAHRIQALGFTPEEFVRARARGNRAAVEVLRDGVILRGAERIRELAERA